jgi:peptidoglycan/xylan/chitin deacetylase (PgdA/CDA1 family)
MTFASSSAAASAAADEGAVRETASRKIALHRLPTILIYHGIADVPEDPFGLCVPPAQFEAQMAWLTEHGLRGVGISELIAAWHAGRAAGLVGLTFDDGYVNVMENALPVLLRHGFTATMFIISELLGKTNLWDEGPVWQLVTAGQVAELADAGMEIGSHSASHTRLTGVRGNALTAEVSDSKSHLSDLFGQPIRGFCYPYGAADAAARHAVREAAYDWAVVVEPILYDTGIMSLPRIPFSPRLIPLPQDTPVQLAAKRLTAMEFAVAKGMQRQLFYHPIPQNAKRQVERQINAAVHRLATRTSRLTDWLCRGV